MGVHVRLLKSPWSDTFDRFLSKVRHSLLLASPYVTMPAAERVASALALPDRSSEVHLHLATNLQPPGPMRRVLPTWRRSCSLLVLPATSD